MPAVARRVIVSGRVQGVYFRDSCARAARTRGVTGWVRNRSDGAVEAVFEGDPSDVEAMCDWCRNGSPRADVDDVQVSDAEPSGAARFAVR